MIKLATRKLYADLTQCRSCKHDTKSGCTVLLDALEGVNAVDAWQMEQEWRNGHPKADATGCPGWRPIFAF